MEKKKFLETESDIQTLMERLFPICRSITGNGVRETLRILQEYIPLVTHEVPTGTKAFDWTVPKEWNIRDAYLLDPQGKKVIDFKKSNLHVVNYSIPINTRLPLNKLQEKLHSLPELPDAIPYKTSYYNENWGFCLTDAERQELPDGEYEVVIDSTLADGSLTYGELYIPGMEKEEILLSCYICHPSMGNDNLTGMVLLSLLAQELLSQKEKSRYSYRFLFLPETIGPIVWLSQHHAEVSKIFYGLVATCVADSGPFTYKKSRRGNTVGDRAVEVALRDLQKEHSIIDFFPSGSDERQYCSPGLDLPVGSLMRTMYGKFKEYHTSADNLDFVSAKNIIDTAGVYRETLTILDKNATYMNQNPFCEPQLGKRGLYVSLGPAKNEETNETAMFWVLNYSDGKHSLLMISEMSGIAFRTIRHVADLLLAHSLLK